MRPDYYSHAESANDAHVKRGESCRLLAALFTLSTLATALLAQEADLIVHHGKVVTVDRHFSVRQAMAIKNGLILRVGTDEEILRLPLDQGPWGDKAQKRGS